MTNLVFFGSSEYSLIILQKLLTLPDFSVSLVVTKIDKPFGRDQQVTSNPVAAFAKAQTLPLLQVEDFNPDIKSQIHAVNADLALCVAFGPPFFDAELCNGFFKFNIVNVHPSPLPKYRGATPGPWQIINGETTSAVTFFQIDPLPDHGPIISQVPFTIDSSYSSDTFYRHAFKTAADSLENILSEYVRNPLNLQQQDHSQRSYFPKFSKENAKIDWSKSADYTERFIRAMQPWPAAWTEVSGTDGKILKMKILSSDLKDGKLELKNVQIEGKKPTFWSEISKYYFIQK